MKASQGNVTAADKIVRAELGTLGPGATATVDVTLQFKEVKDVRLIAVVRAFEPDPQPENNIARIAPKESLSSLPDLTGAWDALKQTSEGSGVDLKSALLGQFTVQNKGKQTSRPVEGAVLPVGRSAFRCRALPAATGDADCRNSPRTTVCRSLEAPISDADVTGFFVYAVIDADNTEQESARDNNVIGSRIP